MSVWLGIVLFLILVIIAISVHLSSYAGGRKANEVYRTFASQNGLTFDEGDSRTIGRLNGVYKGRSVNLHAHLSIHRSGDTVYTEIQVQIDNPQKVELFSGEFAKFQLMAKSSKLLSGKSIFDSIYRLDGSPTEVVLTLLHSTAVRSAVEHLAPNNAPIFERPHFKLESNKFTIRRYTLYSNVAQLQNFLEEFLGFTGLIEEEITRRTPNQAL